MELDFKDLNISTDLIFKICEAALERPIMIRTSLWTGTHRITKRLPGIMPDITSQEIAECSAIYGRPTMHRPYRAPYFTCSEDACIGEVELAHNGILVLPDCTEFTSTALNAVLLAKQSHLNFRGGSASPGPRWRGIIVLIANLCPCGTADKHACVCDFDARMLYEREVSEVRDLFGATEFTITSEHFTPHRCASTRRLRLSLHKY